VAYNVSVIGAHKELIADHDHSSDLVSTEGEAREEGMTMDQELSLDREARKIRGPDLLNVPR
jgi:hypothetical protein